MRCKISNLLNRSFSLNRTNHSLAENSEISSHSTHGKEAKWVSVESMKGTQLKPLISGQTSFDASVESPRNRGLGNMLRGEEVSPLGMSQFLRPSGVLAHSADANPPSRSLTLIGQKRSFPFEFESHHVPAFNQETTCSDQECSSSSSFSLDEIPRLRSPINGQRKKLYAPRNPFPPIQTAESPETSTERMDEKNDEINLDSLPLEVLTHVVCFLRHKDLRSTSLVCKRLREAVNIATALHFNFTTPEHNRHGLRARRITRLNSLLSDGKQIQERHDEYYDACESPRSSGSSDTENLYLYHPPNAPKATRRYSTSTISSTDVRRLVAPLFADSPEEHSIPKLGPPEKTRSLRCSPSAASRSLFGRDSMQDPVSSNQNESKDSQVRSSL